MFAYRQFVKNINLGLISNTYQLDCIIQERVALSLLYCLCSKYTVNYY